MVTVPPRAFLHVSLHATKQTNGNVTEAQLWCCKMFCPPDLIIRGLRPRDVPEVYKMLNAALKDEEGAELKRQIRFIFMHPAIWILSGVLICVFGISLRWVCCWRKAFQYVFKVMDLLECDRKTLALGCVNSYLLVVAT